MQARSLLIACVLGLALAFDDAKYSNSAILMDSPFYEIHWNVNATHLELGLEVETLGWIGFGIGEPTSGSMPGADVLIAWVNASGAFVEDRHTVQKDTPILDECQNWNLISGSEEGTITYIEVTRVLATEDPQDREIVSGINRIIFALSPDGSDELSYHGSNRKALAHSFWGPGLPVEPTGPTITKWTWYTGNHTLTGEETEYVDFPADFPAEVIANKQHLVGIEAFIDPNTVTHVHHYIVNGCWGAGGQEPCTMIWGWAPGVGAFSTPPEAGFPVGPNPGDFKSISVQVHYDNPTGVTPVDNSGAVFIFDSVLRPHDAGVLQLGDPAVSNPNKIKALVSDQHFEYNCPADCSSKFNRTLNVWGDSLHMHKLGTQMFTTVWRDGAYLRDLNRIDYWDVGFQQTTPMNFQILPGDVLQTHCIYDGSAQDTPFARGSREEMCIDFVYYWPFTVDAIFCGFAQFDVDNSTLCGPGNLLPLSNPTILDPAAVFDRAFPTVPEPTYVCEPVVTRIDAPVNNTTTTTGDVTTTTADATTTTGNAVSTTTTSTSSTTGGVFTTTGKPAALTTSSASSAIVAVATLAVSVLLTIL